MPLASAALRSTARRLVALARRHKAAFALGTTAALAGGIVGVGAGLRLAESLGPALGEPQVARALVVGVVFLAVGSGIALGVIAPGLDGLGAQLAAAPAGSADRALAVVGVPALLLVGGVAAVSLPLVAPVVAASPGGIVAVCALTGVLGAGALTGAQLSSAARASWALTREIGTVLVLGALGLTLLAAAGRQAAASMAGDASVLPLGLSCGALLAAFGGWASIACRPRRVSASRRRSRWLGRGPGRATASAGALLIIRRGDLRAALCGAALLGATGIAIALVAGAPAPSGLLLGVAGSALTAAPCALSVGGHIVEGRHVWRLAAPRGRVAAGWCAASLVGVVPAVLVACLAVGVGGLGWRDCATAAAIAVAVGALGLAAGCHTPWRGEGVADQALSLAALGVGLGALSVLASRLGPLAAAHGAPEPLAGAAIVAVGVVVGGASVVHLLTRGA